MIDEEREISEEHDFRKWLTLYMNRYGIEVVIIIVLVILAVNYAVGRYLNHRIANRWLNLVSPTLKA